MRIGDVVVLRRKSSYIGGFVGLSVVIAISTAGLAIGWEKNSLADTAIAAAMSPLVLRLIWRALIAPRVEIQNGALHVIGFWESCWIPLHGIRKLDTSFGLSVQTADGGEIPVFAFSGSNVDRDRTVRDAAEKIRAAIAVHRSGGRGSVNFKEASKRRMLITVGDLLFLPFPVLVALNVAGLL